MKQFNTAIDFIKHTVENGELPSAALAIGIGSNLYRKETFGVTSYTESATPINENTLYDMASVTKILSTTMITLRFISSGLLDLADMLPRFYGSLVPDDKQSITLFHLLTHTSGYPDHVLLENFLQKNEDPVPYLLQLPLVSLPGSQVLYSCLGFILLGKILEKVSGKSLDILAQEEVFSPLQMYATAYHPLNRPISQSNTAFTERNHLTGDWLCGQVHDENAYFLNGVAGNAGVFSNLNDCIHFTQMLANHGSFHNTAYLPRCIFDTAIQNYTFGLDENRGLGFHLANGYFSMSGQFFPQQGFGHNGFTGPHIFVDPASGLYVILLTNRVHPDRSNGNHLRIRRILHTLVTIGMEE